MQSIVDSTLVEGSTYPVENNFNSNKEIQKIAF